MTQMERVAEAEARFWAKLREWDIEPTGDGRVTEAVAARLIGVAAGTLRNWRSAGTGPLFYRSPRITYRLCDLAIWVEQQFVTDEVAALDRTAHHAIAQADIDE